MNMKKFVLPVLLTTVLVGGLFVLTGCGDKKKDDNKSNESNNSNNSSSNTSNSTVEIKAVPFKIQNLVENTTLKEIYASVAGSGMWTPNLLGQLELATGTQSEIALGITELTSVWDFKITDEEGTEVTISSVDLSPILNGQAHFVAIEVSDSSIVAVVK